MFDFRSRLVRVVAPAAVLLTLGVAHGAVGAQWLDPGPTFRTAMAAAPATDQALTIEQEMVDLRAEIRQAARDRVAANLAAQQVEPASAAAGTQSLLAGLRYEANCIGGSTNASAAVGDLTWAAAPVICLNVLA